MPSIRRINQLLNLSAIELVFSPTQAASTAIPGAVLPKNARPVLIQTLGGATGGASPTVDVGGKQNPGVSGLTGGDVTNYFHDELSANTAGAAIALNGAGKNIVATAPIQICAGVGASAAGGGTTTALLYYTRARVPGGT